MTAFRLGDTGQAIAEIQRRLIAHGFTVSTDGTFGPITEAAVRRFQAAHGLAQDGLVGPVTFAELGKPAAITVVGGATALVKGLEMPAVRCWPLRALKDGRKPTITSRHKIHEPSRPTHYGADLLYAYDAAIDPPTKVGDSGRTAKPGHPGLGWWIPPETYAIAPADGVVERCGPSPTGFYCWVRHAGGLATGCFHFDKLVVVPGQLVKMGDRLGRVNDNPHDNDPDHLHGELYHGGLTGTANHYPQGTLDPELWWLGAAVLPAEE